MPTSSFDVISDIVDASVVPAGAGQEKVMQNLLGVAGHFLHHSEWYPELSQWWKIDFTLPFVKELTVPTVAEGIYFLTEQHRVLVSNGSTDQTYLAKMAANRQKVSDYLSKYDAANIKVTFAVLAEAPATPPTPAGAATAAQNNAELSSWVAELLVSHPCVTAVQCGNEDNLHLKAADYVSLYREYATKIKANRPDIKIMGAVVSSLWWPSGVTWLKSCIDLGLLDYVDGIIMHPYSVDYPPEIDPHWRGAPITDPDHREKALRAFWDQVVAWDTTGKPLTLMFTEFGWNTSCSGLGHMDEYKQADYLSRSMFIFQDVRLRGVPLESVYWYDLKEDGTAIDNPQYHYGLVNFDLSVRKPSFYAYKAIVRYFAITSNFEAIDVPVTTNGTLATLKMKMLRRKSDGVVNIVFWDSNPARSYCQSTKVKFSVPIHPSLVRQLYASEVSSRTLATTATADGFDIEVPVTTRPSWFEIKAA